MKELKKLKIKYHLWMIPFYLIRLPLALLSVVVLYLSDFMDYSYKKLESFYWWYEDFLAPPNWYPSQKYLKQAQEIKDKLAQDRMKNLYQHNIIKEDK